MGWKAVLQRLEWLWGKDSVHGLPPPLEKGYVRVGREGEEIVSEYLQQRNWEVVARNYKTKFGEIDLIAKQRGEVVFVEVKSRAQIDCFDPSRKVDRKKLQRVRRLAQFWLDHYAPDTPARIDVVGVANGSVVEHYEDVG